MVEQMECTEEQMQLLALQQRQVEARFEYAVAQASFRESTIGTIEWSVFLDLQTKLAFELFQIQEAISKVIATGKAAGSQRYQLQFNPPEDAERED